jgi:hypothetical protein
MTHTIEKWTRISLADSAQTSRGLTSNRPPRSWRPQTRTVSLDSRLPSRFGMVSGEKN